MEGKREVKTARVTAVFKAETQNFHRYDFDDPGKMIVRVYIPKESQIHQMVVDLSRRKRVKK